MEQSMVVLCGALAGALAFATTGLLLGLARSRGRPFWPILASAIVCLALIASVVSLHWPLRAAYVLSRPSLDRVAQEVHAGQQWAGPTRVGLFTVVQVEVRRDGIVCLWVDDDPGGKTGFVRCGPDHVPFNLWSKVSLDDRWQFIAED
jgi:hypothetical protein